MKVWITKYALTLGIFEIEAEACVTNDDLISYRALGCMTQYFHGEGKEWHRTREAAVAKAEGMVDQKLQSLRKQIKKLEAMKF